MILPELGRCRLRMRLAGHAATVCAEGRSEPLMRLDRVTVRPLLDQDAVVRPRVLAERDGRVLVMVTRDVGMTHVLWLPVERR